MQLLRWDALGFRWQLCCASGTVCPRAVFVTLCMGQSVDQGHLSSMLAAECTKARGIRTLIASLLIIPPSVCVCARAMRYGETHIDRSARPPSQNATAANTKYIKDNTEQNLAKNTSRKNHTRKEIKPKEAYTLGLLLLCGHPHTHTRMHTHVRRCLDYWYSV